VPRVVATRPLLPRVEKALRESFAFESLRALDRSALAGAEGLVTVPGDTVDAALLDAAGPQLRVVAQHAVGFDNVDLEAATERGVVVTNTPDVLTAATAEFTLALLLALVRRVAEGDRLVRAGGPWSWEPTAMLGTGLAGKTLGLVGRGRIGGEVARLAGAFGMRVVHTSRSGGLPLAQLLSEADVVSLHVPLTAETRHLIDAAALERMGPQALLVNTTRGPVVDESALADALEAGTIAGAALDVFEREPEVEPRLLSLPNVVLTPHVASATVEAREAMGMLCVDALRAVLLEGRAPENALNPEALS
jgi:glyoxylate reductase